MLKPLFIAFIGLAVIVIIKTVRPEFALSVRLCVILIIAVAALSGAETAVDYIGDFYSVGSIDSSYIKLALKIIGICIITQTAADICRDCSETALATQLELTGRFVLLALTIPLIKTLFETGIGLIK